MNVVVIAPHPDDESLGCGGTLPQYTRRGDRVVAIFLTSGEHALKHLPRVEAWKIREAEASAAAEVLGLSKLEFMRCPDWFLSQHLNDAAGKLRRLLERESPDVVFIPHEQDAHPDHRVAQQLFRSAAAGLSGFAPTLLAYEVWTPMSRYNRLVDIGPTLRDKLRAVRCYRSQLDTFRYDQAVRGLNRFRGALHTQWRYAEAFDNLTAISDAICTGLVSSKPL
jgi:LmbE family N-acetylglucosaminyl deacetylase